MRKVIAGVASDWHLERAGWKAHPTLAGDSYYGLQQVVDFTIDARASWLLAPGDLFNVKLPDSGSVRFACRQLDRLQSEQVHVAYTQGQHELVRVAPWLSIHWWPKHVHRQLVELAPGLLAYGLDWLPRGHIQSELDLVPVQARVLLAHQVWREMWNSAIVPGECSFTEVPGHIELLLTGDYHVHRVHTYKNAVRDMLVGSPGALCLQALDQPADKYFLLLYDDLTLASIPLKSRRVYTRTVDTEEALAVLLQHAEAFCEPQSGVPPYIATNIVHVRYDSTLEAAYDRLHEVFAGHVHLFIEPLRRALVDNSEVHDVSVRVDTLFDALDLEIPPDNPLNRDARRLLVSTDLTGELNRMRHEHIAEFLRTHES